MNQKVDINILSKYRDTLLQLLFKQNYFDSELSNLIVQIFIAAETDINKTYNKIYNKIFLLYFQVLEAEARRFSDNYYKKK